MLGVGSAGPVGATNRTGTTRDSQPSSHPSEAERNAWAVLSAVDGLGPVGFEALLARYGTAGAILDEAASPGGVVRLAGSPARDPSRRLPRLHPKVAEAIGDAAQHADRTVARIAGLGLRVVTTADQIYPRRLATIEMPPPVLFVLGDSAALEARSSIAIVGTRRATDPGRSIAARIAASLVAVGSTIVSGLATGIDGAAHAATVHAGGTTIAVIGSGHAALFPRVHERLADSIVRSGGAVVSELAPDVEATVGTFPRRNRVISGLADATVVVEAPARSGALITASWALEQGRECFIVPGPIDARASAGCLSFLSEFAGSARIVTGIPQLIDDLGLADHLADPGISPSTASTLVDVGEAAGRIGRELVLGRATVDELVAVTGWPVASVLTALTMLERHGLALGIHGRFRPAGRLASSDPAIAQGHAPSRV